MSIVVFNPTLFKARYPEFASVSDDLLTLYFSEACLYLSNADCSPMQDINRRTICLNMLTAHVAFLGGVLNTDGKPNPVGRVSAANEGSVGASFEFIVPGTQQWFAQTQYGAAFWQATSSLRGFKYFPQPTRY